MKCSDVHRHLEAYWARALAKEEARAIDEHLAHCDDCLDLVGGQELLADLADPELERMVLLEPPPLPETFTAEVMERVAAERPQPFSLLWPWLRTSWSRHQYASVAYALCATIVVVSAGNGLFLWSESTDRLSVWLAQIQAYWAAAQAYVVPVSERLLTMWHALTTFLY